MSKRNEGRLRRNAALADDLKGQPRVPVVVDQTKRGKELIATWHTRDAGLRDAADKAHKVAAEAAVRHGVDARPGSTARVKCRDDDPAAWDEVVGAFELASAAEAAHAKFLAHETPDKEALRLLEDAIVGVHLNPLLRAAPRVFDFVTAIRNVVMAAQPGMTLKEFLQPFYVRGGGRPPTVDHERVARAVKRARETLNPAPMHEVATSFGITERSVRKIAAKKKPG